MAWVITASCEGELMAKCVSVCPEKCIETNKQFTQYFIDPYRCTDCGLCDLVCPVAAIFNESMVPDQWKHYVEKNRTFFERKGGD